MYMSLLPLTPYGVSGTVDPLIENYTSINPSILVIVLLYIKRLIDTIGCTGPHVEELYSVVHLFVG